MGPNVSGIPRMAADKVILSGLMANLPAKFGNNHELQASVKHRFMEYIAAVQEDFTAAGLEELEQSQIDSTMVGSMMHQYFGKGMFGEEE